MHELLVDVYRVDKIPKVYDGKLENTPVDVYWDSYLPSNNHSTISGPMFGGSIYTGIGDSFSLQVRDDFSNTYNATLHAEALGENSLYDITLVGKNNPSYDIKLSWSDEQNGYYIFNFLVDELEQTLVLNVLIYTWDMDEEVFEYRHI